jgi:nucleoside-triphosphatase
MRLRYPKTLVTGKPGVGKTTLIQTTIERMGPIKAAGFYTAEIRAKGVRVGFELVGLNGQHRTLAHVDISSQDRVGKYGVDTIGLDSYLQTLDPFHPDVELLVIDEIGKMELFSHRFRNLVCDALASDRQVLASVALAGNGFIRTITRRPDIHLFEVTHFNRDGLPAAILEKL